MSGLLLAALETRDRAVRKLAASERRYRQLSELSRDDFAPRSAWRACSCPPPTMWVFGYAPARAARPRLLSFLPSEDVAAFRGHFAGIARVRLPAAAAFVCIGWGTISGSKSLSTASPRGDRSGKPEVVLVARDITRRKIDDAELQESEERYRKLIELMPDALVAQERHHLFCQQRADAYARSGATGAADRAGMCRVPCSASREPFAAADQFNATSKLPCADMRLRPPDGRSKDIIEVSSSSIRLLWGDQCDHAGARRPERARRSVEGSSGCRPRY